MTQLPKQLERVGCTRVYKGVVTPSYSSRLADIRLPDVDGGCVRLGALWKSAPAAVVFLRHYG